MPGKQQQRTPLLLVDLVDTAEEDGNAVDADDDASVRQRSAVGAAMQQLVGWCHLK